MKNIKAKPLLAAGAALVSLLTPSLAWAQQREFDIPAQPANRSIPEFARQAGIQVIAPGKVLRGVTTPALKGSYGIDAALELLLKGARLDIAARDQATIILRQAPRKISMVVVPAQALAPASAAQSRPAPAAVEDAPEAQGLQEIIVTAQRREQKAQDVPIAVAAFGSDQMSRMGVSTSNDLPAVVPGLANSGTPIRTYYYLRGIGNNSLSTSPSVLTYVDGVYQPFNPASSDFAGVETIEIAKGPQGTLFGRNATAGVIQITTANPMNRQGVDVQLGYANYETVSAKAYGAAKFSDNAAASLSVFYNNQNDGWGDNIADGRKAYTSKSYGARGKLVMELDDSFTATLVGDYAYQWTQVGAGLQPAAGYSLFNPALEQTFTLPGRYDFAADNSPYGRNREGGVALTLDKRLGDIKLLSISSYRRGDEKLRIDNDATGIPYFNIGVDNEQRAFSQEFQASGDHGSFNWVAGLFYFYQHKDVKVSFSGLFPSLTAPFNTPFGTPFNIYAVPDVNAYAAYAQGTMEVLPATNLTLGARYTIEKQHIEGYSTGSPDLSPGSAGTVNATFRKPTFRAALDHKFTRDLMAYASYNRGFNAGFFNQNSVTGFRETFNPAFPFNAALEPVDPEGIDAYEIGVKSEWFDRRLQVNVAAFLYDYTNLQQQIFLFGNLFTLNAAAARIKGIDLDITARPMRDLTLSFSANYLDPKYKSYPLAPLAVVQPNGDLIYAGSRDAKGKQLVQAPKYGVQASVSYRLQTAIGTFDTSGNVNYQSRMFTDPQNDFPIRARTLISLTERWTSNDEHISITAWVKNLTNEYYNVSGTLSEHLGLTGLPGAPRTYGVTLGYRF